ncbi:MAG: glycosyltransferase family 2 protein [Gemmataceae bacterium]
MNVNLSTSSLSLVIPAFNEAAVIAQAVREAEAALATRFRSFEILVVDDGSSDDTPGIVDELHDAAPHTRLIRHEGNKGYGAALRTGFEAARFPLIAFTDADCQFELTELGTLAALAEEHPIVVGYRLDRKDVWKRRFFSWGYNRMARTLLGTRVRDVDCALKVFRREALAQLLPESRGFFVNTEMMTRARQLGFPLIEVPVTHRPRASGESKVSLREIPKTATRLLRFWWSNVVFGPKPASVTPVVFQTRVVLPATREQVADRLPSSESALPTERPAQRQEAA